MLVPKLGHLTEGDQVPEGLCSLPFWLLHLQVSGKTAGQAHLFLPPEKSSPRKEWENLPLFSFSVPPGETFRSFQQHQSSQVISPPSFQVRLIKEEEPHWLFWFQLRKETTGERRRVRAKQMGGPFAVQPQHASSELADGVASTEDSEPRLGKRKTMSIRGPVLCPWTQPSLRNSFPH